MRIRDLDEKLILDLAAGDTASFHTLYSRSASAVYGFALSILKNHQDAEDIMQETFIRILNHADTYRANGKPLAWILTITKNLSYNRIRDGKVHEDLSEYGNLAAAEGETEQILDRQILQTALQILDEEEREIVILHAVTGLKHREIAEILDLSIGTVLSKYNRALKKMRTEMTDKKEEKQGRGARQKGKGDAA